MIGKTPPELNSPKMETGPTFVSLSVIQQWWILLILRFIFVG